MTNFIEILNFSFVIPKKLAGLAMPSFSNNIVEEIAFLKAQRISTLLNLGDMEYLHDEYRLLFTIIDEPVAEFEPPRIQQMKRILSYFYNLKNGERMGVHCAGGVGRTGTVLACILGSASQMSGQQAINTIRKLRPNSIESESQEQFILNWCIL